MKLAFTVATPECADTNILALCGNLEDNFQILARLGYQGAELMVRDPSALNPEHIKAAAANLRLEIPCVSTGQLRKEDGLQLCSLDDDARSRAVARCKEVIDFTFAVGARQINIGTLRGHIAPGQERSASIEAAKESLSYLLRYAGEKGVGIALEPQNRFVINWLNSVGETLEFMRNFPGSNLSILFDVYHALFEEPSVYASLIRAYPYISHMQIADSNRQSPGRGQVNFTELVRVLRALDYQDFISIEIVTQPNGAQAAEMAARHIIPLIQEEE